MAKHNKGYTLFLSVISRISSVLLPQVVKPTKQDYIEAAAKNIRSITVIVIIIIIMLIIIII